MIALTQYFFTGHHISPPSPSYAFDAALVREISPQDFLYRDSIPFTFDEKERSFTCGHCGIKFVSDAIMSSLSGKERIMKHMEYVHTLGKHGETHLFYPRSCQS